MSDTHKTIMRSFKLRELNCSETSTLYTSNDAAFFAFLSFRESFRFKLIECGIRYILIVVEWNDEKLNVYIYYKWMLAYSLVRDVRHSTIFKNKKRETENEQDALKYQFEVLHRLQLYFCMYFTHLYAIESTNNLHNMKRRMERPKHSNRTTKIFLFSLCLLSYFLLLLPLRPHILE